MSAHLLSLAMKGGCAGRQAGGLARGAAGGAEMMARCWRGARQGAGAVQGYGQGREGREVWIGVWC